MRINVGYETKSRQCLSMILIYYIREHMYIYELKIDDHKDRMLIDKDRHDLRYDIVGGLMDKRQVKTRKAIFNAFVKLLETKSYQSIIVQDIIDEALIGRSTFYSHFDTKDDLLEAFCKELFDHIMETAANFTDEHELAGGKPMPAIIIHHLLKHLEENDNNILGLLSCDNNEMFLRYFKASLKDLIQKYFFCNHTCEHHNIPHDFIANHIAGSFVEMVLWWLDTGRKYKVDDMAEYFYHITEPIILEHQDDAPVAQPHDYSPHKSSKHT